VSEIVIIQPDENNVVVEQVTQLVQTAANSLPGPQGPQGATGATGATGAKGDKGDTGATGSAATIAVGTTSTGAAGTSASVNNSGTSSAAVFNFTIPQGAKGDTGNAGTNGTNGTAATIAVGSTTTGAAGTSASVTNSGTSSAATFNFTIPRGDTGATGSTGSTGATGSSGVIAVNAPLTNAGTSTSANLSVSAGSTSTAGVLQLTDSTSSTSTTTAATPNSVKSAYDIGALKPLLKMQSGYYFRTPVPASGNVTIIHQRTYYIPIFVPETTVLDRIAIQTGTIFSGTATMRLGIYNNTNGLPSTVVVDGGTVSCTASSTIYEVTISQSVAAGFYWLAMCQQGTAPSVGSYLGMGPTTTNLNSYISAVAAPNGNNLLGWLQSSVTGAFATAASLVAATTTFNVWARAA